MKKLLYLSLLFISATLLAQENKPNYVAENYTKKRVHIKMRDGAELFTVIYSQRDVSKNILSSYAYA
jgi:predicted acyl esterase